TAAEQVCGVDPLASEDMLDLLSSLVDKSLVMSDERADAGRYRMLETIRDYGRHKLERAGESAVVGQRHCEYYFVLAKAARNGMLGPQQAEWIRRVETELDNVRAAIALGLTGGGDPVIAVKIAVAMQGFWILTGRATEGRDYIRVVLTLPAVQAHDVAFG